ncbi:MAG: radical SAM-associated putative lipoprotein [Treponemataceae bacterium]|nr:radical SAM-associated putative lipoprotein [Treponemataceae bacterium]
MGIKIKSLFKGFSVKLLQILGITSLFTACGDNPLPVYGAPVVAMYGVPGNYFILDGKVTDDSNNPIQNIRVQVTKAQDPELRQNTEENQTEREFSYYDFFYTDENGNFHLDWNCYDSGTKNFIITTEDIDGEANGSFNTKNESIEFTDTDFTGETSFGNEKYHKTGNNISMEIKE